MGRGRMYSYWSHAQEAGCPISRRSWLRSGLRSWLRNHASRPNSLSSTIHNINSPTKQARGQAGRGGGRGGKDLRGTAPQDYNKKTGHYLVRMMSGCALNSLSIPFAVAPCVEPPHAVSRSIRSPAVTGIPGSSCSHEGGKVASLSF